MAKEYIEQRDEGYWITGTRVSLDSIVYAFLRGASPESIAQSFPVLSLEEVYGAIAFYLANQSHVDSYLLQNEKEFEEFRKQNLEGRAFLGRKLEDARQHLQTSRK